MASKKTSKQLIIIIVRFINMTPFASFYTPYIIVYA